MALVDGVTGEGKVGDACGQTCRSASAEPGAHRTCVKDVPLARRRPAADAAVGPATHQRALFDDWSSGMMREKDASNTLRRRLPSVDQGSTVRGRDASRVRGELAAWPRLSTEHRPRGSRRWPSSAGTWRRRRTQPALANRGPPTARRPLLDTATLHPDDEAALASLRWTARPSPRRCTRPSSPCKTRRHAVEVGRGVTSR